MSETWDEVALDDVSQEITVGHVGPMADQYTAVGVPFLRSLNVEPFRISTTDLKYIPLDFHRRLRKSALKPGDVVIVRTGKPGSCAVIPNWLAEANCSDVVVVRPGPRVRASYVSYVVNTIAGHHIDAHTVGAVQQHFNVASARQIRFRLPPVAEQDRILNVLGALDDKIDLNRRMNETLEAMARAIFKDWFADFGPTRTKMEGRAPYLAPDIWALFPDRLDDEGKPEGWTREPLLKHARLISGGTPKTAEPAFWNGAIAWASAKDVSQCNDAFLINTERTITEQGLNESATRVIPRLSTVVVARGATTGRYCMFGRDIAMNQTCYALASLSGRAYWLYCAFGNLVEGLVHAAHGSVFDTITTKTIESARPLIADGYLLDRLEATVAPLFTRVLANIENSETLTAARDLILPKLMSGEIRIKQAEQVVEAAL